MTTHAHRPDGSVADETGRSALPTAFVYFEEAESARAQKLTRLLEKRAKADCSLPDDTILKMGLSMDQGDLLGDAWLDSTVERSSIRQARQDFHAVLDGGIGAVPDASPQLRALFEQINTEPDWLDWDLFDHGAEVFRRFGSEFYPYLGMITFDGYRTPSVTKPLILTGAYTGNSALKRFKETCKHWTDVSEPGGMRRGNPGFVTSLRVRMLHSMIRARIATHPEWDRRHLGVPISQFNMAGTLMAGSFIPGQQLRLLGYRTSDDDIVALMHMWRYIGYVMGVELAFSPETIEDGFRAIRIISLSQRTEDNDDSRELCESFMNAYKPPPDAAGLGRVRAEIDYRLQLGHAAFYAPESYAKAGFPPVGPWRFSPLLRFAPTYLRESARLHVPGAAGFLDRRRLAARRRDMDEALNSGRAGFNPVEKLSR